HSCSFPLFGACSCQDSLEAEVPLVTGVLEDLILSAVPGNGRAPWLRPGAGIVDRDLVLQRVRTAEGESFQDMKLVAGGAAKKSPLPVIARRDHQRVAFPMAAGISAPQSDVR